MRFLFIFMLSLVGIGCLADESGEIVYGIVSPDRVDTVQYAFDRDWDFLDTFESEGVAPSSACGLRFIDGEIVSGDSGARVKLVETLGEFCERVSAIELYGSYFMIAERLGGYLWVRHATDVYLWEEDKIILVYDEWLNKLGIKGEEISCSQVELGPFGETNEKDDRQCIEVRSIEMLSYDPAPRY